MQPSAVWILTPRDGGNTRRRRGRGAWNTARKRRRRQGDKTGRSRRETRRGDNRSTPIPQSLGFEGPGSVPLSQGTDLRRTEEPTELGGTGLNRRDAWRHGRQDCLRRWVEVRTNSTEEHGGGALALLPRLNVSQADSPCRVQDSQLHWLDQTLVDHFWTPKDLSNARSSVTSQNTHRRHPREMCAKVQHKT